MRITRLVIIFCTIVSILVGCSGSTNQPASDQEKTLDMTVQAPPLILETENPETPSFETYLQDYCTQGILIVNDEKIHEASNVIINHTAGNAEVPVIAVLRALGYDATMRRNAQNEVCEIVINQTTVALSTAWQDLGIPISFGAEGAVRRVEEDDFIVDSDSLYSPLYHSANAEITIDFSENIVYVRSFDPDIYEEVDATLFVNGIEMTTGSKAQIRLYHNNQEVVLPVLSIAKTLGAEVRKNNDDTFVVSYGNQSFSFILIEDDFGCEGGIGGILIRIATEDEVFLDYYSAKLFLNNVINADIAVDYTTYKVDIFTVSH